MSNAEYLANRQEWNERYGVFIRDARRWRLIAAASLTIAAICAIGMVLTAQQPKLLPYIVELDTSKQAVAAYPAVEAKPNDSLTRALLAQWIADWRLVTVDPQVQRKAINRVFAYLGQGLAANQVLAEWYRGNDPFERAASETVHAKVEQVLRLSDLTWRVEWTETVRNRDGELIDAPQFAATVTITRTPVTPQTILVNPTGQRWAEFDFARVEP